MWIAIIICLIATFLSFYLAKRYGASQDATAFLGGIFFVCSGVAAAALSGILFLVQAIIYFTSLYNQQ